MMHRWTSRSFLAIASAVTSAILETPEAFGEAGKNDVFRLTVAAATTQNPRNSESDIIQLRDGRILLDGRILRGPPTEVAEPVLGFGHGAVARRILDPRARWLNLP